MRALDRLIETTRERAGIARAGLSVGRETEDDRAAAEALRLEVAALPPLPTGRSGPEQFWIDRRADLREAIASRDPRFFLHWPVVVHTMVVRTQGYVREVELPAVADAGWLPLLSEDISGGPTLIPGTSTSGNLVHHGYHLLRFQQETGVSVADFSQVVEIGAGYGSMARLVYRATLGRAHVTLFDLPEFSALQRYFLRRLAVEPVFVQHADALRPSGGGRRLLIATWSLSEIHVEERERILDAAGEFDAYLIGYQSEFQGANNADYFGELRQRLSGIDWTHVEVPHIPGSFYLLGARRPV